MKKTIFFTSVIGSLFLSGCVFAPSGEHQYREPVQAEQPTIGQELLDLDRARKAGVIDNAEFDRAKARILDQRD